MQRRIADHPQYRWLGPHKGIVHLALASITNACFDLWAKAKEVPLIDQEPRPGLAGRICFLHPRGTHKSLIELARSAEARGGSTPVPIDTVVSIKTSVAHQTVPDRSLVAILEGSDPKLKDEHVLISAHFDHEGADGPRIYNGADDDGSGTVGLLEIAEAYALAARAGQRPRRSIIFAAWNSEERGLLGAWAYAEDPLVPLDRIVAVLNMDMIGRNEEVQVGGGPRVRGREVQTAE